MRSKAMDFFKREWSKFSVGLIMYFARKGSGSDSV